MCIPDRLTRRALTVRSRAASARDSRSPVPRPGVSDSNEQFERLWSNAQSSKSGTRYSRGRETRYHSKRRTADGSQEFVCRGTGAAVGALALIVVWTARSEAYEVYDGCASSSCHGDFRSSPYISLSDGSNWGDDLHDVHRRLMLGSDCDTCHQSNSLSPVLIDSSAGGAGLAPISCLGCHGRAETDAGGSVTGAGLRQHHFKAGADGLFRLPRRLRPALLHHGGRGYPPALLREPGGRTQHPRRSLQSAAGLPGGLHGGRHRPRQ